MINKGLLSSDRDTWETPRALFAALHQEFRFTLDVCALPGNARCGRFYSPEQDGLAMPWMGTCWCNPPYGRQVGRWVDKAYWSWMKGATVVCLLPARTDTAWWHDLVMPHAEVRFLRGRLYFGPEETKRAPFPSAIAVFRAGNVA